MPEDDFDLDLDLDAAPARPAAATPAPAAPAEAAKAPAEAAAPRRQVVAGARPSLGERVRDPFARAASRVWPPVWGVRSFVVGLLALLLALVVVENWPPMRLNLLGLHADIPKAIVLLVDFAAGFGVAWLMLRRGPGRGTPSA